MQVASLDWLPSQTSPISFHHLNLCYTRHLLKCSSSPHFVPLAQKPLCDTAAIFEKFQVTGEGISGALARELFSKKITTALEYNGPLLTWPNCSETSVVPPTPMCSETQGSWKHCWRLYGVLYGGTMAAPCHRGRNSKVAALPGECLLWVSSKDLVG